MRAAAKKLSPDFWLFTATIVLVVVGVLIVFDASFARAADRGVPDPWYYVKKQMMFAAIGFVGLFLAMRIHPRAIRKATKVFLLVSIALLAAIILVPGIGKTMNGAARWIPIGPFHLQPSEFAKLAIVMYLADQFAAGGLRMRRLESLLPHLGVVAVVAGLVLVEPDMGTAMATIFTTAVMLYVAGVRKRHLFAMAGVGAVLAAIVIAIEPYRLDRVYTWLDPWKDYYGNGYQIIQSLIGLGTGGVFGRGLCEGRVKFFIPAPHTDMIGATVAEEAGFVGMLVLLGLFLLFTYRGLCIGHKAKSPYMSLLAIGLTSMISVQALMNIAVFSAAMPMTGVPLPFISYGGSYLLAMLFGAGMVLSVSQHQNETMEEPESEKYESRHHGRRDRGTYISCTEYRPTTGGSRRRTPVRR